MSRSARWMHGKRDGDGDETRSKGLASSLTSSRDYLLAFASAMVNQSWSASSLPPEAMDGEGMDRRKKDLPTCADCLEDLLCVGFQSGGVEVWEQQQGRDMREIVCETGASLDCGALRIAKFASRQRLLLVDTKLANALRFYSLVVVDDEERVEENLCFPHAIDSLCLTPTSQLAGVLLANGTASLFDWETRQVFTTLTASPLAVSTRWYAYGASRGSPSSALAANTTSASFLGMSMTQQLVSSAKSLVQSIARDLVLVRDAQDDAVVVVKLPHALGCSFLQFDESGAFLVSAAQDGQCLFVYSLPNGRLLYRLERGFSPTSFTHVCFSPCRRILAASTQRDTTHIFSLPPRCHGDDNNTAVVSSVDKIYSADRVLKTCFTDGRECRLRLLGTAQVADYECKEAATRVRLDTSWALDRNLSETVYKTSPAPTAAACAAASIPRFDAETFDASRELPPVWRLHAFALMETNDCIALHSLCALPTTTHLIGAKDCQEGDDEDLDLQLVT